MNAGRRAKLHVPCFPSGRQHLVACAKYPTSPHSSRHSIASVAMNNILSTYFVRCVVWCCAVPWAKAAAEMPHTIAIPLPSAQRRVHSNQDESLLTKDSSSPNASRRSKVATHHGAKTENPMQPECCLQTMSTGHLPVAQSVVSSSETCWRRSRANHIVWSRDHPPLRDH